MDGNGNPIDAVFTTSEETDIKMMIMDGMTFNEIIETVKKW
jgi:hypothetical protein